LQKVRGHFRRLVEGQIHEQLTQGRRVAHLESAIEDRQPTGHDIRMIDLEQG
jgi:hypothetical protein